MDIVIKIVECLIVDPELQVKPLEIMLYRDSSCVAALFNPSLAIKNSLLRTAVYGTIQRAKQVLTLMPNAVVHFSWIAGTENAADLVSKVFIDPIQAMNSDLFRHGGTFMLTKEYKGEIFMTIRRKDGVDYVEWKGISNKITKAEENTKKLKTLLETRGEDKMGNDNVEECNLCGEVELCGTYLTTRAQTYGKEAIKSKETRKHGPIFKHDENLKNGKRCIDVQPLMGQNLLKNDGYKYQLIEPIMPKDEYEKRMFTKLMWEPDFRV